VKHLRLQLIDREFRARQRIGPRFLRGGWCFGRLRARAERGGQGDGEDVTHHPRSLPNACYPVNVNVSPLICAANNDRGPVRRALHDGS
jgi:hypothetical protein